jgi:aldehyde dehydrogenase
MCSRHLPREQQNAIFQEEIFGPVLSVTTFRDEAEALAIASDSPYGLGRESGATTRIVATALDGILRPAVFGSTAITMYPAHAAFGGYKQSGIGRETHKMMLDHYRQTKNMLVS